MVAGMEQSPLEQIIVRESVGELMGLLTERQRLIITQFFFCRKTQKEIAKELGVAAPIISKAISSSIRQIRKKYPDIPKRNISGSAQAEKGGKRPCEVRNQRRESVISCVWGMEPLWK